MNNKKITFIAKDETTLLEELKNVLKDYKIKTIKQYIENNMVYINNKLVRNPNQKLKTKDVIDFYFKKDDINIEIIYEDQDILVVNKPSSLLSVGNKKEHEKTMLNILSDYKKIKLFVVHRLDQETSGVLLFAKNEKIQEELQSKWNNIVKLREYYCIVPSKAKQKDRIESYLTMNHNQIIHSTKDKENGWLAITNYELIKYKNNYSLLRVCIETGKRNQIRVHMKENLKPIVGDKKYGSITNPINRLCLHASKLTLIDPRTNKNITFESKIPDDMLNLMN